MFLQPDQFNSEVTRNEVKIFGAICVITWTDSYVLCMWGTVQYVFLLSHCTVCLLVVPLHSMSSCCPTVQYVFLLSHCTVCLLVVPLYSMSSYCPTVQYAFFLSHCLIAICFMSFVLCYVIINCFMCFNLLVLRSFSCFVCFTFYFMCSVFLYFLCIVSPQYIVVYFLSVYNFTDHCHRVKTQLQLTNITRIME